MSLAKESNTAIGTNVSSRTVLQEWADDHPPKRDEPPALTLDERGMIRDCSKAGEKLFGYRRSDLVWQHVSKLLPQLLDIPLVDNGRFNPQLSFLCHCGHRFQTKNQRGNTFLSKLHFVHLDYAEKPIIRVILRPADDAES